MKIENRKLKINSQLSTLNSQLKKGFTLIELLIVIAIIGILGAILISMINPAEQQRKAKMASLKSELTKIAEGAEAYAANYGTYANVDSNGVPTGGAGTGGTCWGYWVAKGYAKGSLPKDPNNNSYGISCSAASVCISGIAPNTSGTNETWRYDSTVGELAIGAAC